MLINKNTVSSDFKRASKTEKMFITIIDCLLKQKNTKTPEQNNQIVKRWKV